MDKRTGFSIVEILVVISIIGILSTLSAIAVNFARNRARIEKTRHDVNSIVTAIKLLENDTGEWPGHQNVDEITTSGSNEIWDLNAAEAGITQTDGLFFGWNGPYMLNVSPDVWGNNLFWDSDYEVDGETYVVVGSFGPNGVGQNVYDSDDIIKILR